jgi:signal transduction histidine kinase
MDRRRARLRRRRLISVALVGAVLLVGFGGTWTLAAAVVRTQQQHLGELMDRRAQAVGVAVRTQVGRYTDTLADLAVSIGAQNDLTAADFVTLTAGVTQTRLPGNSGVALVVPASGPQIARIQAQWRAAGNRHLRLAPASGGTHQFVVLGSLAPAGTEPGRDLSTSPEPSQALLLARSTARVTASATYREVVTPSRPQLSFVLVTPIYGGIGTSDAGRFRGWVMMGLHGSDFITETMREAAQDAVTVTLVDASTAASAAVVVARAGDSAAPGRPRLERGLTITIGGRQWELTVRPTRSGVAGDGLAQARIVGVVGSAFTMLLGVLVATLSRSRARALDQVERATVKLRSDLEHRRQVENHLRERERELQAFAGIVAHDLKAPLNTVAGYSAILNADYAAQLPADVRKYLDKMTQSTERMRDLIDDLLNYASARDSTLDKRLIDLGGLVDQVVAGRIDGLSDPPRIERGELPTVQADPILLRQVIDNLIGNAMKYCRTGVTPQIAITSQLTTSSCRIEVLDQGIGIGIGDQLTIFDAFRRAQNSEEIPGTGLGLAICKRVIERHDGQIGVISEPGAGSRFWFTLPLPPPGPSAALAPSHPGTQSAGTIPGSPRTEICAPVSRPVPVAAPGLILLVEDDVDDAYLARYTLTQNGFDEVMVASDGQAAIELLLPAADGERLLVQFVLLDLNLPRLNGFEVLRRLRADPRTADLPVIVFVPSDDEERGLREQYPDRTWCLRKPLSMTALDAARRAFDPSGSGVQPVPDAV